MSNKYYLMYLVYALYISCMYCTVHCFNIILSTCSTRNCNCLTPWCNSLRSCFVRPLTIVQSWLYRYRYRTFGTYGTVPCVIVLVRYVPPILAQQGEVWRRVEMYGGYQYRTVEGGCRLQYGSTVRTAAVRWRSCYYGTVLPVPYRYRTVLCINHPRQSMNWC